MSEQLQLDHLVINVNDMMDEARNLFETLGFSITEKEIERGINIIEKQNKMAKGQLKIELTRNKISFNT